MTETETLLRDSRAAAKRGDWNTALLKRIDARVADPDKTDAAWADDLMSNPIADNTGKVARRVMRGVSLVERDLAIERYYREKLGEVAPVVVSSRLKHAEIVTPKQWVVQQEGAVNDQNGQPVCRQAHRFQLLAFDRRACAVCHRVEELRETVALEDTDAFKQRAKELGAKP